jgi:K+-sensing histidine kinase KdpD
MKTTSRKNKRSQPTSSFDQDCEREHRSILTSVSHDLKTPLACIIGSLEIYERTKEKLTADKKGVLITAALQNAYLLDSFISNILDMARLESGTMTPKKELCVMDLLLEDCLILLGNRMCDSKVSIMAIPATFPVTTDPLLLMRAICIVLDNAVQYGPAHPLISIEYEMLEDQVVIRIQDNGPGIPKTRMEDIFSKYTRFLIKDNKRAGTGLGLSICRQIMHLLNGTVTAANLPKGKGAVFTLTFAA